MSTIVVRPQQNILDIALQEYGDVQGVFYLLDANPSLDITSALMPGQRLQINAEPIAPEIAEFFALKNPPASAAQRVAGDFNNDFNNDFE